MGRLYTTHSGAESRARNLTTELGIRHRVVMVIDRALARTMLDENDGGVLSSFGSYPHP